MKSRKMWKSLVAALLTIVMIAPCVQNIGAAVITVPKPQDPNAAVYYKGNTTYYNPDYQSWVSLSGSLLYSYKAKKDMKHYMPVFYISDLWVSNNGRDLPVTIGKSYSESVTKVVSANLGVTVSSKNVELATSVSGSYSKTATYGNSYSITYTFDMSNYSKNGQYRPAAFGDIYRYSIIKKNRITGNSSCFGGYTFDNSRGCDLRLAFK